MMTNETEETEQKSAFKKIKTLIFGDEVEDGLSINKELVFFILS